MDEVISKRMAIDTFKDCAENGVGIDGIVDALESLPPAQPERIRGHWVNGHCDKCNAHAPFWAMASTYYESKFCPNCGADMREVTEWMEGREETE